MSDPIAEAAASLSGAAPSGNVLVNETQVVNAAALEVGTAALGEQSAGIAMAEQPSTSSGQSVTIAEASSLVESDLPIAAADALPRESHLMLLEHKLGIVRAKLVNAERVSLEEFEGLLVHIRAVL